MPAARALAHKRSSSSKLANGTSGLTSVRRGLHRVPSLEPLAARFEQQRPQILAVRQEEVVEAHVGRIGAHHRRRHALAVEPLLQVVEGAISPSRMTSSSPSTTTSRFMNAPRISERRRDVVAGAREHADLGSVRGDLDADAVPFPLGDEVARVEAGAVALFDGVGEHHRAEHGPRAGVGPRAPAVEPEEEVAVGRGERVPDLLDVADLHGKRLGERRLGEAGGDTDARRAAEQLQQCPAAAHVQTVEQAADEARQIRRQALAHRGDDGVQARGGLARLGFGPEQRDGLGRVADVIAREPEEHRIDARVHQLGERAPQRQPQRQAVRQRRERPAAVGIRGGAEVGGEQSDLAIAAVGVGQAVEQRREPLQGSTPSSSKPTRASARALRPIRASWCTRASSRPCVTHTAAPVPTIASSSSGQSA